MSNLPVKETDEFLAEVEVMDLTPLKDGQFMVGVSTGDRSKVGILASTIHGPYNFNEMVDEVGIMWKEHQHHAKVLLVSKDRTAPVKNLDENTVDYIEANYTDIVTESMLEGIFDDSKEYTCQAGVVVDTDTDPKALPTANDTATETAKEAVASQKEEEEGDDL